MLGQLSLPHTYLAVCIYESWYWLMQCYTIDAQLCLCLPGCMHPRALAKRHSTRDGQHHDGHGVIRSASLQGSSESTPDHRILFPVADNAAFLGRISTRSGSHPTLLPFRNMDPIIATSNRLWNISRQCRQRAECSIDARDIHSLHSSPSSRSGLWWIIDYQIGPRLH